ncbi:hypothetical protein T06_16586 [Trichinella sp. T6]|nr:hypothetical protein T06_687 [Trichinella sp. T6]KRX29439.1 hypothetical protein T06_16586 [Trichinella sp. T6]
MRVPVTCYEEGDSSNGGWVTELGAEMEAQEGAGGEEVFSVSL